jgi:hypothetical protein
VNFFLPHGIKAYGHSRYTTIRSDSTLWSTTKDIFGYNNKFAPISNWGSFLVVVWFGGLDLKNRNLSLATNGQLAYITRFVSSTEV